MRLAWETGRDKGVVEEVREKRAWEIRYLLLSFLSSSVRTGGFSSMVETCVVKLIAQLQCLKSHKDRCWVCGFVELWTCSYRLSTRLGIPLHCLPPFALCKVSCSRI